MGIDRSGVGDEGRGGIYRRRSGVEGGESGEGQKEWGGRGIVGIYRRGGVGGRESGDRQEEWGGRGREWGYTGGLGWEGERVEIDRRSGVGGGESGDIQEEWGGRGREWG